MGSPQIQSPHLGEAYAIVEEPALTLDDRRQFMKLPIEERRRRLGELAEKIAPYYETNVEWTELQGGDIVES